MKVNKITFTGITSNTSAWDLGSLILETPGDWLLELGFLFLDEGPNTSDVIEVVSQLQDRLSNRQLSNVSTAVHLCQSHANKVAWGEVNYLTSIFNVLEDRLLKRIQININASRPNNSYNWDKLLEYLKGDEIPKDCAIILQMNDNNEKPFTDAGLVDYAKNNNNLQFIYDRSGGKGRPLLSYPIGKQIGAKTGYAGGISPDSVEKVLFELNKAPGDGFAWIDMESGIREDGKFSVELATEVIKKAKGLIRTS